jgi:hypothetical protein
MGKGDRKMISLPIIPLTMIPLTNFVENDWFSQIARPAATPFGKIWQGNDWQRNEKKGFQDYCSANHSSAMHRPVFPHHLVGRTTKGKFIFASSRLSALR